MARTDILTCIFQSWPTQYIMQHVLLIRNHCLEIVTFRTVSYCIMKIDLHRSDSKFISALQSIRVITLSLLIHAYFNTGNVFLVFANICGIL